MIRKVKEILYSQRENSLRGIKIYYSDTFGEFISYADLYNLTLIKLGNLQHIGIEKGQEIIMDFDDYKDYFSMLWAGILGDYIVIPFKLQSQDFKMLNGILNHCLNPVIFSEIDIQCESLQKEAKIFNANDLNQKDMTATIDFKYQTDLIMVQFSSGSTSAPKGVMVSDENILTNIADVLVVRNMTEDDIFFAWTPMTHNMSLLLSHVLPVFLGANQIFLSTQEFIRRPKRWLEICSMDKVTFTTITNYGVVKLLQVIDAFDEVEDLKVYDLSLLKEIIAGSDVINVDTKQLLLEKLRYCNVVKNIFSVGYGLSEATLGVTFTVYEEDVFLNVDRLSLQIGEKAKITGESEKATKIISVGKAHIHVKIEIVDLMDCTLGDLYVGIVKIKGESITKGYYQEPFTTDEVIDEDGWLDTGDIGFIKDGLLYITGRYKDLILFNGKNYYSNDIEEFICKRCITQFTIVVIGIRKGNNLNDTVVCYIECNLRDSELDIIVSLVRTEVVKEFGIIIDDIIQIASIPRTISNKVNRYELKERYTKKNSLNQSQDIYKNSKLISEVEDYVITIFQDAFGKKLSLDYKLSELCFTSIETTGIHEKLLRKYPFVTIADLYESKYISDLVDNIILSLR